MPIVADVGLRLVEVAGRGIPDAVVGVESRNPARRSSAGSSSQKDDDSPVDVPASSCARRGVEDRSVGGESLDMFLADDAGALLGVVLRAVGSLLILRRDAASLDAE